MWGSLNLNNLQNLVQQAQQQAQQAGTLIVNQAQETFRKASGDSKPEEDGEQNKETAEIQPTESSTTKADGENSEQPTDTTKQITDKADQLADSLFNFASSFADTAYNKTVDLAEKTLETATLAHAMASDATTQLSENKVVSSVIDTIESKTFIGDFNRAQSSFIQENQSNTKTVQYPWDGYESPDHLKDQILALSQDKRNFQRNPPAGVSFTFDYKKVFPTALAVLEVDENLRAMRFELVPKKMKEEIFWRNYFYRVGLIKQTSQLKQLSGSRSSLNDIENTPGASKSEDLPGAVKVRKDSITTDDDDHQENQEGFASADFDPMQVSADDLQKEMEALGMGEGAQDWENELSAELQEYEVVEEGTTGDEPTNGITNNESAEAWEKEIEDMLKQ